MIPPDETADLESHADYDAVVKANTAIIWQDLQDKAISAGVKHPADIKLLRVDCELQAELVIMLHSVLMPIIAHVDPDDPQSDCETLIDCLVNLIIVIQRREEILGDPRPVRPRVVKPIKRVKVKAKVTE